MYMYVLSFLRVCDNFNQISKYTRAQNVIRIIVFLPVTEQVSNFIMQAMKRNFRIMPYNKV